MTPAHPAVTTPPVAIIAPPVPITAPQVATTAPVAAITTVTAAISTAARAVTVVSAAKHRRRLCYPVPVRTLHALPQVVVQAVTDFKQQLATAFPGRLRELRVFGSMARGEADEHSDVDVLVVLDRIRTHAERVMPMELSADVGLPRGLVINALVLDEAELQLQRDMETGLAESLDRDGVVV